MTTEELIQQTAQLEKDRRADIADTRLDTISAIRRLERGVMDALETTRLEGLRNIGDRNAPLYAGRVRGDNPDAQIMIAPRGDSPAILVLLPDGSLAMASWIRDRTGYPQGNVRPATDDDLLVEDLGSLIATLAQLLPRHMAIVSRKRGKFAALRDLAAKVITLLEGAKP